MKLRMVLLPCSTIYEPVLVLRHCAGQPRLCIGEQVDIHNIQDLGVRAGGSREPALVTTWLPRAPCLLQGALGQHDSPRRA